MSTAPTSLHLKAGHSFLDAFAAARAVAPDAFGTDRLSNLWGGEWRAEGQPLAATSPIDGSGIVGPPMLDAAAAQSAMDAAVVEHHAWSAVPLAERKARVREAIARIDSHRELLSLLMVWEIGKPWWQAMTAVERTVSGVEWYCDEIDGMLEGRKPLAGPVSNIASWNYPLSVLVHAMLVEALSGNAVIAKPAARTASKKVSQPVLLVPASVVSACLNA